MFLVTGLYRSGQSFKWEYQEENAAIADYVAAKNSKGLFNSVRFWDAFERFMDDTELAEFLSEPKDNPTRGHE